MGNTMRMSAKAFSFVAALLACGSAQAEAQKERLLYDVMFGGLHVADVVVSLDQNRTTYLSRIEMRTRGIAEAFQDFRADMRSEGAFDSASTTGNLVPTVFSRQWASPKVASDMTMRFDTTTGRIVAEERLFDPKTGAALTPEDMPWRERNRNIPPVPDNLRAGAVDPMAAFLVARQQVLKSGQNEVRVPIYDGRRRYDIVSTVGKARTYTIKDQPRDLLPITSRVVPVFGFAPESEERMLESKGTTLFSTDGRFVPVQIILGNELFSSVMNLTAECNADPTPCDNFGKPSAD
jgi:hypothetical protein